MNILINGLSIQGNMGAALLLEGIIQGTTHILAERDIHDVTFFMTSPISSDVDHAQKANIHAVTLIDPLYKLFAGYMLYRIGCHSWAKKISREIALTEKMDLVIDSSGISFTDNHPSIKRKFWNHIYFALHILIPHGCKKPIVKFTQSIGPLHHVASRIIASYALKRANVIIPRDHASHQQLVELKLHNIVEPHPDIAITLHAKPIDYTVLPNTVGICVSGVLARFCEQKHIPYLDIFKTFIQTHPQMNFLIIPHADGNHDNDLVLSEQLFTMMQDSPHKERVTLLPQMYTAKELKYIIGECSFFIGARYHALISALTMAVPSIAISWNQKYNGLFDLYGVSDYVLSYNDISIERLTTLFASVIQEQEHIKQTLQQKNRDVQQQALDAVRKTCSYV